MGNEIDPADLAAGHSVEDRAVLEAERACSRYRTSLAIVALFRPGRCVIHGVVAFVHASIVYAVAPGTAPPGRSTDLAAGRQPPRIVSEIRLACGGWRIVGTRGSKVERRAIANAVNKSVALNSRIRSYVDMSCGVARSKGFPCATY
jgi:hypothetical protein